MRWLVVPRSRAPAVAKAICREYARATGRIWNEELGGIGVGVNEGKGIHALHKSITTEMVHSRVSLDGTEVAFQVTTVNGVSLDAMRGLSISGERIPDTAEELPDAWFKIFEETEE